MRTDRTGPIVCDNLDVGGLRLRAVEVTGKPCHYLSPWYSYPGHLARIISYLQRKGIKLIIWPFHKLIHESITLRQFSSDPTLKIKKQFQLTCLHVYFACDKV